VLKFSVSRGFLQQRIIKAEISDIIQNIFFSYKIPLGSFGDSTFLQEDESNKPLVCRLVGYTNQNGCVKIRLI